MWLSSCYYVCIVVGVLVLILCVCIYVCVLILLRMLIYVSSYYYACIRVCPHKLLYMHVFCPLIQRLKEALVSGDKYGTNAEKVRNKN